MVYTSFAVLASSLLLVLAMTPVQTAVDLDSSEAARIGEASFFMESVLDDMDRSLGIATRRALTGATNYVIETGEPLARPGQNLTSATVNGTISGNELNATGNASLSVWTRRVSSIARESGYHLDVDVTGYSFNASGIDLESSYSVNARLRDPATLATFNRTRTETVPVSARGLEDTMLLLESVGRYVNRYQRCSFDDPADRLYTGATSSAGTAHGSAVVRPADAADVDNSGEKILVAQDIDNYATVDVNGFAGAVSAEPNSSGGYTTEYAFDTGSIAGIEQNTSLVINAGDVWRSGFRQMFREGCYVPSPRGPDVLDRLGNRKVSGPGETGIATLVEVPELPPELQKEGSAVGYVYFNETGYGSLNRIRGVSQEHTWFRLDDHHVELWDIEPLAY
ncbi:MAG: hypothetical protein ABEK00_02980 [Candidatus Nanohaloarchaea archaeon]